MGKNIKSKIGTIVVAIIFIGSALALALNFALFNPQQTQNSNQITYRAKLNVKIYGDNYRFDSSDLYSNSALFVDENNNIYKRAKNLTMGDLFSSIGITFNKNCFDKYCSNENITLEFYVNGKSNKQYNNYNIQDGDDITILYGTAEQKPKTWKANRIKITSNGFQPLVLNITVGNTVTWINKDSFPHGIKSNKFKSGIIGPDSAFEYTFFENGTYNYNDTESEYNGAIVVS